jgi:O-antigen/teichoic acid export membrane protein
MLRFAAPLVVSGACMLTIHFSDLLFLAHVNRTEVAVYALAYSFALLPSALIGNSFSKFWDTRLYAYASDEGWQSRFAGIGRWLVVVLGLACTGVAVFGRDMITIMTPASYDPPYWLLPLLVFSYFLRDIGGFFNSTLLVGGGSGRVGKIALAVAALNLALNARLIPPFGIWGAAWATCTCWGAYCVIGGAFAWRVHIMLALSAGALWLRSWFDIPNGLLRLALDAFIFSVFLSGVGFLALNASERGVILALIRRLGNKQAGSAKVSPWSPTSAIS